MIKSILNHFENFYEEVIACKKIFQLLKKLWNIFEYVALTIFIFTLLIKIETVRELFIKNGYSKYVIEFMLENEKNIYCFLIIGLLIFIFYKNWKTSRNFVVNKHSNIYKRHSNKIHKSFIHKIRDSVKELNDKENEFLKGNQELSNHIKNEMNTNLIKNLQDFVDTISEILTSYCDTDVSCCIKTIDYYDKNIATTIARSTNTRKYRVKQNEKIQIDKYCDFSYLCNGLNSFYGKSNLVDEYNNGNYNVEENIQVWGDKYVSTLIAPIRYYDGLNITNNVELKLDILGFLCIDCKTIMKEWENENSYELSLLAIFADSLYTYIKKHNTIYYNN